MKRNVLPLVACALGLLSLPADGWAGSFPGRDGAVVFGRADTSFVSDPTGDVAVTELSLGIRRADGSEKTLASCSTSTDAPSPACTPLSYSDPAVSPNGRLVAFSVGTRLGIVGTDGTGLRLLPQVGSRDETPAFSPDGRELVFATVADRRIDLSIGDLAGHHVRTLVRGGIDPTWSTRGWIAFRGTDLGIYRVRPNGHKLRLLARNSGAATWSPNGRRIAFARGDVRRNGKLVRRGGVYVADADGRHARRLGRSAPRFTPADLAWSPDGKRLLVLDALHRRLVELDTHGRLLRDHAWAYPPGSERFTTTVGIDWQPLR